MLHTEMPWYAKLGTAILAITIGGGCIIAILLALPIGLVWDLASWLRRCSALSPACGAAASGGASSRSPAAAWLHRASIGAE